MASKKSNQSIDEPKAKRPKMETDGATSSNPEIKDHFLSLPPDVLAKIIVRLPVAQWPSLESLDQNFRAATFIAWRQLRDINVDRDFSMKSENVYKISSSGRKITPIESLFQKLADRSPFVTSICGIADHLDTYAVDAIARFKHLQSISLDGVRGGLPFKNAIRFLESTRSRTNLKELRLLNVDKHDAAASAIIDQFAASFVGGRQIQSGSASWELESLQLERFELTPYCYYRSIFIRLDTLDTTRLTDLRAGKGWIQADQWTCLIERASNLRQIELSFLHCGGVCNRTRLQANKNLLSALASHENLTAITFGSTDHSKDKCMDFGFEFIEMLKTIGRRGLLRKLALNESFVISSTINMDEVCATIRSYIPNLRSIKISGVREVGMLNIAGLTELEEIDLAGNRLTGNVVKKIAQLSRLRRLAIRGFTDGDKDSHKRLADVSTLMDLRIGNASLITADVYEKWSDGFASNLQCLMLSGLAENIDHDGKGLALLLEKAVELRVLILKGRVTDQSLMAIAKSCPNLEILGVELAWNEITMQCRQKIVDRCQKLKRLGGFGGRIRSKRRDQKYRKICSLDLERCKFDLDEEDQYD